MKILLDENIDVSFKREFTSYDIETVRSMGWSGKQNGKLLDLAVRSGFDDIITLDTNLKSQLNISAYNIIINNLRVQDSKLSNLKLLVPEINKVLSRIGLKAKDKKVNYIEIY